MRTEATIASALAIERVAILATTHLRQADEDLEKLIGVRSRAITAKLRSVEKLDDVASGLLLGTATVESDFSDADEPADPETGDSPDEI